MKSVFVDTHYFVAAMSPSDQWHTDAVAAREAISGSRLVTTEAVLIEVLNFVCEFGPSVRDRMVIFVRRVLIDPDFEVVSQKETTVLDGIELYESRLDKGYSLTDCISMNICRAFAIEEVLSGDKHFNQEGFKILL